MIEKQLAEYIRNGSYDDYVRTRYPAIPDGEEVVFTKEDFSNVNFHQFVMGFMIFKNCILDGASIKGQPITVIGSNSKRLDLTGVHAVIDAYDSDFRELEYDERTFLGGDAAGSMSSQFHNCLFDQAAKNYFVKQGVVFEDTN